MRPIQTHRHHRRLRASRRRLRRIRPGDALRSAGPRENPGAQRVRRRPILEPVNIMLKGIRRLNLLPFAWLRKTCSAATHPTSLFRTKWLEKFFPALGCALLYPEIRSSKSEIRKKSEARSPKPRCATAVLVALFLARGDSRFRPSDFGLLSDFGNSDFGIRVYYAPISAGTNRCRRGVGGVSQ